MRPIGRKFTLYIHHVWIAFIPCQIATAQTSPVTSDHGKDKNNDDSALEENTITAAMVEEEAKLAENTQKEDDKRMEEEVSDSTSSYPPNVR